MTPDMREMMRSMSIVSDGSDNFVSADEYLQPQIDDQIIGDRRPLQNVRLPLGTFAHDAWFPSLRKSSVTQRNAPQAFFVRQKRRKKVGNTRACGKQLELCCIFAASP